MKNFLSGLDSTPRNPSRPCATSNGRSNPPISSQPQLAPQRSQKTLFQPEDSKPNEVHASSRIWWWCCCSSSSDTSLTSSNSWNGPGHKCPGSIKLLLSTFPCVR